MADSQAYLLSIDLGTTSCKAALFALDGRRIADFSSGYPLYSSEPGAAEQDPQDWHAAVLRTLGQLSEAHPGEMRDVVGIGLTAQINALVLVDEAFHPLGRAPSAMDQRPVPFSTRLRQEYGAQLPGIYIGRNSMLGRIVWFRERRPQQFAACARVSDARGLLCYWLTGDTASDPTFGVWSWIPELEEILSLPLRKLPAIVPAWQVVGRLRPELASRFGLPRGIPVVVGSGDGSCANLGVGANHLRDGCISLGTTAVARAVITAPLPADVGLPTFSYPFMDGLWFGGAFYPAGAYLQWLGNLLDPERAPEEAWDWLSGYLAAAESLPPGADGLVFSPHVFGHEGSGAEGYASLIGLNLSHRAGHILRAILEGTAVSLRAVIEYLSSLDLTTRQWRATGGGMKIPLWRQILSSTLGQSLESAEGDANLGAAMLAAVGAGIYPNLNAAVRAMEGVVERVATSSEDIAAYQQVYERYQEMTPLLPTETPSEQDNVEGRAK